MRKRPDREMEEKKFIESAEANIAEKNIMNEDLHVYVKKNDWPFDKTLISPSLDEGSNLRKHLTLSLTEKEWKSIDRHTKAIGINKTAWIRHAAFKLMQEEQLHFFKNKGQ